MKPPSISAVIKSSARTTDYRAKVAARSQALQSTLRELLDSHREIVWEVGCGHGHFLTAYAATHPGRFCVGIDIVRDRIQRASRKRNRAGLSHLHFVLAEAREFLDALPAGVRFSAIYILFPDPWPKRRHHKNRLMQPSFLDALFERAEQGTRLHFRTDFEPYFTEVSNMVNAHQHWDSVSEPWPFELETVFQARARNYFSLTARKRIRA